MAGILGLAGIVIGSIALADRGGGSAFAAKTLNAGKGKRVDFQAPVLVNGNPAGVKGWESNYPIAGDATGEVTWTCVPLITNDIGVGGFQLQDGDINVENIEQASPQKTSAEGSILGGSGAYEGAYGSFTVNWQTDTYTLHPWLLKR